MIILLKQFWNNFGIKYQAINHDIPMGAATFHPDVFFGIIKNEVINDSQLKGGLLFQQKCRRPLDSLSTSQIRMSTYDQFQVIIDLHSFQDLTKDYLHKIFIESLNYIGIDIDSHEIAFIDGKWDSPSLGALGTGWEVRIDNVEVCQITYFTNFAGFKLNNIILEFAYGVERLQFIKNGSSKNLNAYADSFVKISLNDSINMFESLINTINFNLIINQNFYSCYDLLLELNHLVNLMDVNFLIDNTTKNMKLIRIRELTYLMANKYKDHVLS